MDKTMKSLLLILALLTAGCGNLPKKASFNEQVTAKSTVLTEILISMPIDIKKYGDRLYVSDFGADSLLFCYNLKERHFEKQMLPRGQGAGEFLSPIEFFMSDTSVFIHNRWHFTARDYSFSKQDLSIQPKGELVRLPMGVDKLCPLGESRVVASGVFDDCRFFLLDKQGNVLSQCGDYPNYQEGEEAIPNSAKAMFHQSQLSYNASRKRLACVTNNVFELWDYTPETLTLHKRLLLSPYHYKFTKTPDGVSASGDDPDAMVGALGITTSDKHVYVLVNPNTCRMHDERKETQNSEIWVFDWEGRPVRKILADVRIESFCIDETDSTFYCVMATPDYSIGMIQVPSEPAS